MRKLAFATLVFVCASLTACGGTNDAAGNDTATHAKSSDTTAATPGTSPTGMQSSGTTSDAGSAGSDPGSAYCAELKSAKAQFQNLDFQALSEDQFKSLTSEFETLASTAPDQVKGDWATLSSALTHVQQILAGAGLSFDDLKGLSANQVPPGVTVQQLTKLGKQLQQFAKDTSFQDSAAAIARQAKAECGIDMGS